MDYDITLKREMFALNIRRDQRDRKMKEIREVHAKMTRDETHRQHFNEGEFKKFEELSRKTNFAKDFTAQAFQYLFSKDITSVFSNENNLQFIFQFTQQVDHQKSPQQWQVEIIQKIIENIKELIKREISLSPKEDDGFIKPTQQLDNLSIMKKCFYSILSLARGSLWYLQLVLEMSAIRNKDLKKQIFSWMKQYFGQNYKKLCLKQIEVIVFTILNLYEDLKNLPHEMISILQILLTEYDLMPNHVSKIVDFFNLFLENYQICEKIKFLIEDTSVYEGLIQYFDKSKNSTYQLVQKLGLFVFKMYSPADEELCQKVFSKNTFIITKIRSWLPLPPSTTTPRPLIQSATQLIHTNFSCTQSLISALTNICASGLSFLSIILTQYDTYFSVISLFLICPVSCRQEIAIFVRNCVYSCDKGMLRIILDGGLVQLLIEMIRDQGSSIIVKTTLVIILWMIRNGLEENPVGGEQWGYSRGRFIRNLESLGGFKDIQLCQDSDDPEMNAIAGKILNVIR